jgi:tRNA-dihydrouridine synthase 3
MSLCLSLLNGSPSEWSHLRRHESEDIFGAQITASRSEHAMKIVKALNDLREVDFIDFNCGCPTEFRLAPLQSMAVLEIESAQKWRTGITSTSAARSVATCRFLVRLTAFRGKNTAVDWRSARTRPDSGMMIARGAFMSPWLFAVIKERRTWDISSRERLDIIRGFCNHALDHWGSDAMGVENCRRYLLEKLSFSCRYIPVGLLEVIPQKINDRPPKYKSCAGDSPL